jgi:hypothetical protein
LFSTIVSVMRTACQRRSDGSALPHSCPVAASQNLTTPSRLPEASTDPSGANVSAPTDCAWPQSVARSTPRTRSHSRTVSSTEAEASNPRRAQMPRPTRCHNGPASWLATGRNQNPRTSRDRRGQSPSGCGTLSSVRGSYASLPGNPISGRRRHGMRQLPCDRGTSRMSGPRFGQRLNPSRRGSSLSGWPKEWSGPSSGKEVRPQAIPVGPIIIPRSG